MSRYDTALVLGLGASGDAAARLLLGEGSGVIVIDEGDGPDLRQRAERLASLGARVLLGQSGLPGEQFSVCVVSPGVPADSEWIRELGRRGIKVMPELELGWSRAACRVLAVTGSNGKSTLVELCARSLERAGLKIAVAGNCEDRVTGDALPVSRAVPGSGALDWLVLEVSSFQLETADRFRPDVGVLLNVFPNHLDRHGTMAEYKRVKHRLFCRMTEHDIGIVPDDMMPGRGIPSFPSEGARWVSFGVSDSADFRFVNGEVIHGANRRASFSGTMFDNEVLGSAAAAAVAAVSACGADGGAVESALRDFMPLPHRMQDIGTREGVRFIDDSKATSLSAMCAALKMTGGGVRLIAGGKPKGEDYADAIGLLRKKVVGAYLVGEASKAMFAAWRSAVRCAVCETLEKAVNTAFEDAEPGETILLSPGCSSKDQFSGYRERGNSFRQCSGRVKKKA